MNQEHSVASSSLAQGELLNDLCARALGTAGLALILGLASSNLAQAQTAPVSLPGQEFSGKSDIDQGRHTLCRQLQPWRCDEGSPRRQSRAVHPAWRRRQSFVLGVLADEKSDTLYLCSNDITGFGVPGPGDTKGAWLKTFDLASGAPKGSYPLKDPKSLCNDIVVGSDGTAYITNSFTPNVYRLKPGGTALEVWATDPLLAPAKDGVGLDGIAIGADGNLYVSTYIPAALFKIAIKDGKAGTVTALKTSRATRPCGCDARLR